MRMRSLIAATALFAALSMGGPAAHAAGDPIHLEKQDWSFSGLFGTFDRASVQRGLQVYREVCATCHSLNYISFRNLADLSHRSRTTMPHGPQTAAPCRRTCPSSSRHGPGSRTTSTGF